VRKYATVKHFNNNGRVGSCMWCVGARVRRLGSQLPPAATECNPCLCKTVTAAILSRDILSRHRSRDRVNCACCNCNKMAQTRHRTSTSMYSITFSVRVTTPAQYGRNGTAHAAGASMILPARGVFAGMRVRHACGVRWAWWITAVLCHAFP